MGSFAEGDTVRLKSGGPLMTVTEIGNFQPIGPQDGVKCVWFERGQREEEVFDSATLKASDNSVGTARVVRG